MVERPLRQTLLFASTYAFPVVAFPLVSYAWFRTSGSWSFVVLVMGVPVLFGYVMPWVATDVVQRWRFTAGPRVGSYYAHHGFIYGSKLAFALLLVIRSIDAVDSLAHASAVVLVCGAVTAFGGWFHDTQAVRAGKIAIDDGEAALATFAPPSYFTMGATYAAVALIGYRVLTRDAAALIWMFPLALVALCVIPTLVFLAVDPPTRQFVRARFGRTSPSGARPAASPKP
jgi:hypothetical protein